MTAPVTPPSNLLLDQRLVHAAFNARLALGTVRKHPQNPLFSEEGWADPPRHWEMRFDNLYPTVIKDPETGRYRAWYFSFIYQELTNATPLAERPGIAYRGSEAEEGLLYAESDDGIEWTRPDLGIIEFEGSTANNLVMRARTHGIHAGGVMRDDRDPDPSRRYKCLFRNAEHLRMAVAFSPDGLHWSEPVLWPEHDAKGDTHNNTLWAPELGRYVGITRGWTEGYWMTGQRLVLRTESTDFIHWSDPDEIMRGHDYHDQPYSMPIARYGDLYIGLPAQFHKGDRGAPDWDTVTTELAWSPDTITWHRICPGEPLIPTGAGSYPTGEYDCGCVYAAAPVLDGDTIRLYYGGSNGLHNGWRESSLNLATLERDRFAGYTQTAPGVPARVTTVTLSAGLQDLTVNADVRDGGSVRVAVLDEAGETLPGMALEDCQPIREGGLDVAVTWGEERFEMLAGREVRILFEVENAVLFAFSGASREPAHG
ncbi:MAG: hypothetical protein WCK58_02965 [Chloroflexota bacterium]